MKKLILALPLALVGAIGCVDRDRDVVIEREVAPTTNNPSAQPGRGEGERESRPTSSPIIEAEPALPSDDQAEGDVIDTDATGTDADVEAEAEMDGEVDGHTGHDDSTP